jgi:hypothetical protein
MRNGSLLLHAAASLALLNSTGVGHIPSGNTPVDPYAPVTRYRAGNVSPAKRLQERKRLERKNGGK